MKEEFLQYIWANSLFRSPEITTSGKRKIRVLNVGEKNLDSGPDFFNARIAFDGVVEVGNIEIERSAREWNRHGHHEDDAFENVLLVVVQFDDGTPVFTAGGREVETVCLEYHESLWDEYCFMQGVQQSPRCYRRLNSLDGNRISLILSSCGIERLQERCVEIRQELKRNGNDWESCFYLWFIRYWSGSVNADAFQQLAQGLSYKKLLRCSDNLFRMEALLFGYAGLLQAEEQPDEYVRLLRAEYDYMEAKYRLEPMKGSCWKFLRIRPTAFPTVRIALLAALIYRSQFVFSALMEAPTLKDVYSLLDVQASAYWDTHYRFGHISSPRKKRVGRSIQQVMMINAVIPFLFVYGKERGEEHYCEKALKWMEELPPEQNSVVASWKRHNVTLRSAFHTQALLHINRHYCKRKRCLECRIGNEVFRSMRQS